MTNVSAITVLMLMPISPATCWFCDVARIAMPSFVRYTSASSPPIMITEVTMIDDLHVGDRCAVGIAGDVERHHGDDLRKGDRVAAPDDHRQMLEDDRQADRRDERREPRRVAQRPVRDALERVADGHADGHRHQHAGDEDRERRQSRVRPGDRRDHRKRHHRADHHDLAVREIDQLDDAVHHRVAERDDGVDAAERQPVDDLLQENVQTGLPRGAPGYVRALAAIRPAPVRGSSSPGIVRVGGSGGNPARFNRVRYVTFRGRWRRMRAQGCLSDPE